MSRYGTHGVQLLMSDMAGSPTFTLIAQVTAITPPGINRGFTEIAEHDMTGAIEKLADALYNAGAVRLRLNWDPGHATHDGATGIKSVAESGTETNFRIIFPDTGATQFDFASIVTQFQPAEMPANSGVMMADVVLEVSGAIAES